MNVCREPISQHYLGLYLSKTAETLRIYFFIYLGLYLTNKAETLRIYIFR